MKHVIFLFLILFSCISCFLFYKTEKKHLAMTTEAPHDPHDPLDSQILFSSEETPKTDLTVSGTLRFTNLKRRSHAFPPLHLNAALNAAAEERARHMFAEGYFDHNTPTGESFNLSVVMTGYEAILTAENIALGNFGDDEHLVKAWYESPGHKKNLLFPNFQEIGIATREGIYRGEKTWIAVQLFAIPISACESVDSVFRTKTEREKETLDKELQELESIREEIQALKLDDNRDVQLLMREFDHRYASFQDRNTSLANDIEKLNHQVEAHNSCVKELIKEYSPVSE